MIQCIMFSRELSTAPTASVGRRAILLSLGPTRPVAPGTPSTVWQPPQPLAAIRRLPFSGSAATLGEGEGDGEAAADGGGRSSGKVPLGARGVGLGAAAGVHPPMISADAAMNSFQRAERPRPEFAFRLIPAPFC
jgi:hypothetical protein